MNIPHELKYTACNWLSVVKDVEVVAEFQLGWKDFYNCNMDLNVILKVGGGGGSNILPLAGQQ